MNIGLVGYFGSGNYGDELFVEVHRRSFVGHKVTVLHSSREGKHNVAAVAAQDAIIIGGGDLIITNAYVDRYWDPVLLRRPVAIAGVGVDFRRGLNDDVARRLRAFFRHDNVRHVTARDTRSQRWISENLEPLVFPGMHADLAASLPFVRSTSSVPTVGIVVRANEAVDKNGYNALVSAAHRHGYVPKTIVLGTGITRAEDLRVVRALTESSEDVVVRSTIAGLTSELARCDLVASQRFHGCLSSILMGIPTIGLLTSEKFAALFKEAGLDDYILPLGDRRLAESIADFPRPASAAAIASVRASAKAGVDALHRAVIACELRSPRSSGPSGYGGYWPFRDAFLDGRDDRTNRWEELSPRLKADPGAGLDPYTELAWYREEIRKRKGLTYLRTLDRLIDRTPALNNLQPSTRAIVAIPVAGTAEHDHIYGTLSLYAQQDRAALAGTVVLLYVNYPQGVIGDPRQAERLEMTLHQIESARRDFSQLRLATVVESFDPELPRVHRGIIGFLGRRLYDLAMMSVQRAGAGDVLLIRNDADALGMSRRYLKNLLLAADQWPNTDVFQGGMRWGTHRYRDYPGYGVVMAFKEALRALTLRPTAKYSSKPGTNGSNVAIRIESLAAVGGVGNSFYYGAGGDDVEIGLRIHAARRLDLDPAPRRPIRYVPDTQIDASGERSLYTYRSGRGIIQTWDRFNSGPGGYTPRNDVSGERLIGPERFDGGSIVERIERNFNDLSQGWYTDPALVDTALRCIVGGEDDQGRAVFRLTPVHGRTCIDFTPAGREWIKKRLTETHGGAHAPYGRRLRRALYGEGVVDPTSPSRMVTAI